MGENEGDKAHRKALEFIASHPGKFGFKDVVDFKIEDALRHEGKTIVEVDVIFFTSEGDVILVEYKNSDDKSRIARQQLTRAAWWFGRYRPDVPYNKIHSKIVQGYHPAFKEID